MAKATAVPLFNYRKRQCQAILSDPQQLKTSSDTSTTFFNCVEPESDRKPSVLTTSNNKINNNADQSDIFFSKTTTGNNVQRSAPNPARQTNLGLMNVKGRFVAGTTDAWSKSESTKGESSYKFSRCKIQGVLGNGRNQGSCLQGNTTASRGAKTVSSGNNTSRKQPCNVAKPSCSMGNNKPIAAGLSGNQTMASSSYTFSGSAREDTKLTICGNQMSKYELSSSRGSTCQNSASTSSDGSDSFTRARNSQTRQSQCHFRTLSNNRTIQHKTKKEHEGNNMDAVFKDELSDKTYRDTHLKNRVIHNNQSADRFAPSDLSMRIFTCTIAMLRSWQAKGGLVGLVMFEVYGMVDSALIRDTSRTGKQFVLRDGTSTVTCIFYEIDREIPRMIRGQMCRVVGSIMDKLDVLRVVSVRSAHIDERPICQAATELSRAEIDKLTI